MAKPILLQDGRVRPIHWNGKDENKAETLGWNTDLGSR